jgi:SAM-dependent methyltransferase
MRSAIKQVFIRLRLIDAYRRTKCVIVALRPAILFSNRTYRRNHPARFPIPSNFLIYLAINNPSVLDYFRGGFVTFRAIRRLLRRNQIDIAKLESILDFGCGCGRVIREFPAVTDAQLFGCDYNPKLANWCARYLYCGDFRINGYEPPSPYTDSSFDFVYLISVFTHLPVSVQQSWLHDLHRIVKQNGHVLITLHGEHLLPKLTAAERRLFENNGYVERSADDPGSNHFGTFHSRAYFEKQLANLFTIVDHSAGGQPNHPYQDLYLLKRN